MLKFYIFYLFLSEFKNYYYIKILFSNINRKKIFIIISIILKSLKLK